MFLKLARYRLLYSYVMAALVVVFAQKDMFYPAFILIIAGAALRIWAAGYVKKNDILAISGPYAYVRNPLYLGTFLASLGMFILIKNWWLAILYIIGFAVFYGAIIKSEEGFLRSKFQDEFDQYTKNVPAFIPRFSAYKGAEDSRFMWEMVAKNHEYNTLLYTIGTVIAIFIVAYIK